MRSVSLTWIELGWFAFWVRQESQPSSTQRIFVKNCTFETSTEDLRDFFEDNGFMVEHVYMPTSNKTQKPKGFAFVDLRDPQQVDDAIDSLNSRYLLGRALKIETSKKEEKKHD